MSTCIMYLCFAFDKSRQSKRACNYQTTYNHPVVLLLKLDVLAKGFVHWPRALPSVSQRLVVMTLKSLSTSQIRILSGQRVIVALSV